MFRHGGANPGLRPEDQGQKKGEAEKTEYYHGMGLRRRFPLGHVAHLGKSFEMRIASEKIGAQMQSCCIDDRIGRMKAKLSGKV